MIVRDLDVVGVAPLPSEADSPLITDPDAVLSGSVSGEPLQPVPSWHAEVLEHPRGIEQQQLGSVDLGRRLAGYLGAEAGPAGTDSGGDRRCTRERSALSAYIEVASSDDSRLRFVVPYDGEVSGVRSLLGSCGPTPGPQRRTRSGFSFLNTSGGGAQPLSPARVRFPRRQVPCRPTPMGPPPRNCSWNTRARSSLSTPAMPTLASASRGGSGSRPFRRRSWRRGAPPSRTSSPSAR